MAKFVINLKDVMDVSTRDYIRNNVEMFKSTTPGPKGADGPKGPQGVGVHHMKGTSTTDPEGDFSTAGEYDTYTFYADAHEEFPLAWFTVKNGEDPWRRAVDRGYRGTEEEFYTLLGMVEEYAMISLEAMEVTTENREQVALDAAQVAEDRIVVEEAKDLAVEKGDLAKDSLDAMQELFLGHKDVDPATDNLGNPLVEGALYYNTVQGSMKVFTGTEWAIAVFSASGAVISFNGRDGAVSLQNSDITVAVGKNLVDAIKYSEADKVLTDVNKLNLSTDTSLVAGVGQMTWNPTERTVDIGLDNNVVLQTGQEMLALVRNGTASTIVDGTVVMLTGSVGNSGRLVVAPYDGTSDASLIIGLATEPIATGADGFVTNYGKIRGIRTNGGQYGETWVDGDVIYVKDSGNGALTKAVPLDTQVKLPIAIVVNAHATNGVLFIRVNSIDENHAKAELVLKANALDAVLTGSPTATTAAVGDDTTRIATTAFVVNEINKVEEW